MYENWILHAWPTPFARETRVDMERLTQKGRVLSLVVSNPTGTKPCWQVSFPTFLAYRNWNEEYRTTLWTLQKKQQVPGWTFFVANESSLWIRELRQEPIFETVYSEAVRHFVIATTEDVVEVIGKAEPQITPTNFVRGID